MMKIQIFIVACDNSCVFWRSHVLLFSEKRIRNQFGFSSEVSSEQKGASPSNLP